MTDRKLGFSTLQIHGGQEPDSATGSRAVPYIKQHHTVLIVFNMEQIYLH